MKGNRNERNPSKKKRDLTPSRARKEEWKEIITRLYLQGHSQRRVKELAEVETGGHVFSLSTVNKYINEAVEEWKENKEEMINNHKAIELEKINRLETVYWDGYLRSLTVLKTVKTKKTPLEPLPTVKPEEISPSNRRKPPQFSTVEQTDESRDSIGDVRYLNGVQWCVEYRCKLLGIEAPLKIEQNTTLQASVNQTTTYVRKVVFKTRETTAAPQIFQDQNNN